MIAKRARGGRRHGVDGIAPDQLIDVENVPEFGILSARAGPKQSLRLSALGRKLIPLLASEDSLVTCIRGLGIRDGRLAVKIFRQRAIDGGIDPAHEETRHARYGC